MYFDSAYIAKYYLNDIDAGAVRIVLSRAPRRVSSDWALVEVTSAIHRRIRERLLSIGEGREMMELFTAHVSDGMWDLLPITDPLLRKTAILFRTLPANFPLRAGDALHLATALDAAETEIWTGDRHLLAAANHFGLIGRCVS
jgi:predicted nucleic acid-binding protein